MKIALCLIVKGTDEEALLLKRCLTSMAPFVDGIFITRTHLKGEKPNAAVANVAHSFDAVVSDFEWVHDFAEARAFNFSQVPKEFDWILWSDADDIWRGLEKLKTTMKEYPHVDAFAFPYLYDWDEWKKPTVVHHKTMLVKNDGATKWVGPIHEDLMPMRQLDVRLLQGIERLHLSSKERYAENAKRNLKIAAMQVNKLPDDPRSLWDYANSLLGTAKYKEAEEVFEDFIASSRSNEEIYLAHLRLADIYKALGEREKAVKELQIAIGLDPMLPDAYFILAYYYFTFGDLDKAEQYSLQGLVKRPQIMKMIVYNPRDYDYNPMMLLAKVYHEKNRPDLMLPLLKGCLKIYPDDEKLQKLVKEGEKDKKMLGKALEQVKKLQKIKDKVKLKEAMAKIPAELQSHPALAVIRNVNFVKTTTSGRDLVIYCGNTAHQWNSELFKTKGFGGSEEAVIHLAREWAKLGWNVTVYNNCGHKEVKADGVTYKPFWEFNYRDKQDVVILWRWAKPLDAEINATKILIDLHDVPNEGEFTSKRLEKLTKIMLKSKFQRTFLPNVPDNKIDIVPNGLETYYDPSIKKDPYLIINTSSPDRCMDVLPQLFKEVKKQVPQAKLQWAYGWDGFKNSNMYDLKKIQWMEDTKKAIKDAGIEDLGRITQEEVGKLYQKASFIAYPTEFAEIDCISIKKAQAAQCIPVSTDFGALKENMPLGRGVHSKKNKDNWNKPYQFSFGLEGEEEQEAWVELMVDALKSKLTIPRIKAQDFAKKFDWPLIAKEWAKHFI
jgi:tetratricopeptide (TPR) repeat protein